MAFQAQNVIRILNAREVPASNAQGANYYFESDGQAFAETFDRNTIPPTSEYWYANGSRNGLITWNKQSTRDTRTSPSEVGSVFGREDDIVAQAGDYDANQIDFTPTGNLTATNSQTAAEQLLTEANRVNAFIGKTFGNELPNFSSNNTVADGDPLETAIGKLDAALNIVTTNSVVTFNGRDGVVAPQTSDYDANQIDFTPTGTITAIDTQAAIAQLLTQLNTVDSAKANKITQIITPTGTSGLAGGGDLSADRTLVVDIPNTTALGAAPNVNDELLIYSIANAGLRAVKVSELLDSTTSGLSFSGTWNATTNTPALNDADGVDSGTYYKTNTAGTINLGSGSLSFNIGDWIIYNGSAWEKVDQTDQVTSVFSRSGDITAQLGDYTGSLIGLNTVSFNNNLNASHDTVQKLADAFDDFSPTTTPLDTSQFNGLLSATENTPQKAFDKLDDIDLDDFALDTTNFDNILSPTENTPQKAFDKLDDIDLDDFALDTTNFDNILSPTENTVQKALDVIDDAVKQVVYNTTNQTGSITVAANTFYTQCNPANATQDYTFPASPSVGDKVGFRISGVTASIVPTLVATIDGVTNVDINENGDFIFVYTGSEWTAALLGINYA